MSANAERQTEGPTVRMVRRRGPLFRKASAAAAAGLYGLDLTAGCGVACPFCHIRGSARDPGPGRILFDPRVAERIGSEIDAMVEPPERVVLSPSSDPLPPDRAIRAATLRVIERLRERDIAVELMTRGRVTKAIAQALSPEPPDCRANVAITTLDRALSRTLEPRAPVPAFRLKGIETLLEHDVPVEIRLEPLIPGLTDTVENLKPLFRALAKRGVRSVTAHYLFLQTAMKRPLQDALTPLGLAEKLIDDYDQGPVFSIGSIGATKHLPLAARKAGLGAVIALGSEFGLTVVTGRGQNPDLPVIGAGGESAGVSKTGPQPPLVTLDTSNGRRRDLEDEAPATPFILTNS